jgi:hypothetical protein
MTHPEGTLEERGGSRPVETATSGPHRTHTNQSSNQEAPRLQQSVSRRNPKLEKAKSKEEARIILETNPLLKGSLS